MDKLVLAEDTSNIDMSSDGLRKQKKKKKTRESEKSYLQMKTYQAMKKII